MGIMSWIVAVGIGLLIRWAFFSLPLILVGIASIKGIFILHQYLGHPVFTIITVGTIALAFVYAFWWIAFRVREPILAIPVGLFYAAVYGYLFAHDFQLDWIWTAFAAVGGGWYGYYKMSSFILKNKLEILLPTPSGTNSRTEFY